MSQNFNSNISVDCAPKGKLCDGKDCGRPALYHLTVIGGRFHNISGLFCGFCSEVFAGWVGRADG